MGRRTAKFDSDIRYTEVILTFCGQEFYSDVNSFWSISDNLPSLIPTFDVLKLTLRSTGQESCLLTTIAMSNRCVCVHIHHFISCDYLGLPSFEEECQILREVVNEYFEEMFHHATGQSIPTVKIQNVNFWSVIC